VNVAGVAVTLAAFAPAIAQGRRGTLACIASVAGFRGLAGNGAYSASKAAAGRMQTTDTAAAAHLGAQVFHPGDRRRLRAL